MDYQIRELKAKDVKTLAKMIGKLRHTSLGDILVALKKPEADKMEVGLILFREIAATLTDDIYAWLADLIGTTPDKLDEMPPETPVEIVKTIIQRGSFKGFFGQALNAAKNL